MTGDARAVPRRLTRRHVLLFGASGAVLAGGGVLGYRATLYRHTFDGRLLTPPEAHRRVRAGQVTLIDIRRPDEWAATGVAQGAQPLDMRREDFVKALEALLGGDRSRPVALICARGVRSDRTARRLAAAGFTRVSDVSEGMLGSPAGPGWLSRGLPVERP